MARPTSRRRRRSSSMMVPASMLPSVWMRKTMRKARNRRSAGWGIGLAGSFVAHLCLLGGLLSSGSRAPVAVAPPPDATAVTISVTPVAVPIDPEGAELSDPPLPSDAPPVARPWDAPAGERDNPIEVTVAPSEADGRVRLAPAPDQGTGGGPPPGPPHP